jgi:serine/threonine protein kinase
VTNEYLKRLKLPKDSDYLVRTLNLYRVSSKAILQMELCRHGDISQGHFDEVTVWKLIHDVGNGLCQIHQLGWMHLDVSPSNILRDDQIFKLADFGTLTKIGDFVEGNEGAGPYVSPEALAFPYGRNPVNAQTDIFSFGAVLLETLTGQLSPRGGSDGYRKLRRGELGLGSPGYTCSCSDDMTILVNAMLSTNPNCRPTSQDLVEIACGRF